MNTTLIPTPSVNAPEAELLGSQDFAADMVGNAPTGLATKLGPPVHGNADETTADVDSTDAAADNAATNGDAAVDIVNPFREEGATAASVVETIYDDETGAQSMEYVALACGGGGLVALLLQLLADERVQDFIIEVILSILEIFKGGMFPI